MTYRPLCATSIFSPRRLGGIALILGMGGGSISCDDDNSSLMTNTSGSGGEGDAGSTAGDGGGGRGSGAGGSSAGASTAGDNAGGSSGGASQLIVVNEISGSAPEGNFDCEAPTDTAIPDLQLTNLVFDFSDPIYVAFAPGDDSQMFVVEKDGRIRILKDGAILETPFLDITNLVAVNFGEMGLLGFAFHPNFDQIPKVYVYYSTEDDSADDHSSVVVEYSVSDDDANRLDPASARELLRIDQPQVNHNGGNLQFGPDGFLYIALGDGGGGGDSHGAEGNGQNLDTLLGKILRIDVNNRQGDLQYAIPSGNMQGSGVRPEIWSYGWRNPWRFSFDACTGDMYVADVGQGALEEVDFEPAATPGRNYGWRLMEAENCFNPGSGCDASAQNLQLPVASYGRAVGQSITGGYVYRGAAIPALHGAYFYADFATAAFFALRIENGSIVGEPENITSNLNGDGETSIASFGQDNAGNLYVVSLSGTISRVDPR